MNELALFLAYATKVYHLGRLLRGVRDQRSDPLIPARALLLSLVMGVVLRVSSYLALSHQTQRRRWQHLIHWRHGISHDAFSYGAERLNLEDLRQNVAQINKQLKANKVLESCKIHGLLFLSLDANEHFKSRCRCCPQCCQREITETDEHGQKQIVIEYYHRNVFAQINGPKFNGLLDVEPIRPGEGEAEAGLRLLGRIRRIYGVRFFDAVTIDSWYVQGPFLKGVEKLGWSWIVVLKQERMEVFQEARQLSQGHEPDQHFYDAERKRDVQLWEIKNLSFSKAYGRNVRVVHSHETWTETKIVGGEKTWKPRQSDWWWMVCPDLEGYPVPVVYQGGHRRWGIENKAFNELTQHYHLEHCYHHEPCAMLAQMLILILGFLLFTAYAVLHSQRMRTGMTTLKDLAEDLKLALEADLPWDQWFACG